MLFKLSTDKTVSEAAAALQTAVQANRFGVMQVHNLIAASLATVIFKGYSGQDLWSDLQTKYVTFMPHRAALGQRDLFAACGVKRDTA